MPLKERVAGIDLMLKLIELAAEKHFRVYFFGAKEEVVTKVVEHFKKTVS
ncbi:WecB/TagA/CpsF family glycosyltransferase [Terrilactibacillus sp. S3-3]|nr:WecB/TagA/CpsF family glycosyltransferase [Terrilactibacillus sp. S3-3]